MKNEGYILIVEDSKTQAKQLDAILKQLGYRIVIAYSFREAFFILKEQLENRVVERTEQLQASDLDLQPLTL